jgi:C4-dicarboxylate transporter DctM subunit
VKHAERASGGSRAEILGTQLVPPPWRPLASSLAFVSKWYDLGATSAAVTLMAALVIVVGLQVFFRYILNSPLPWPEEVSGYLFVWAVFLGATMTIYRGDLPAVKVFVNMLPPAGRDVVDELGAVFSLITGFVLIVQGIHACVASWAERSPALQIAMTYPLAIIPISGLGLAIHYARILCDHMVRRGMWIKSASLMAAVTAGLSAIISLPPVSANIWILVSLFGTFVLGVPVAIGLISTCALVLAITRQPLLILPERLLSGVDNPILMAIPFFMLTGALMQESGIAHRLVEWCTSMVGRFRGGLAYVDIVSSAFFSDISGSPVADTAAIGSIMLPEMVRRGYDPGFAAALQAASGSMGMLIPPSIATIIYCWLSNVSVSAMFAASLLPALLMMISFAVVAYVVSTLRRYPREQPSSLREIGGAFRRTAWGLLTPVIILGGILSGAVTPSEAGVVAVVYTLGISALCYRSLSVESVWRSLRDAVLSMSRVMFILSGALLLSWLLTLQLIPQALSREILSLSHNPTILLILLMVILVIIHEVLETASTLILLVPLVLPILTQAGVDPVHLGILFLVNSSLGIVTPPIGFLLYIAADIVQVSLEDVTRSIIPFWVAIIADLALLLVFPQITVLVPKLMRAF